MRSPSFPLVLCSLVGALGLFARGPAQDGDPTRLFVDAERGKDTHPGSERRPLRSLSAALELLPEPLASTVTIEVRGVHRTTGGRRMDEGVLALAHRMRPGCEVRIVGRRDEGGEPPVLAWEGDGAMIDAREGTWRLESLCLGTFSTKQRRGLEVAGPATVTCKDLSVRTRSNSDAGILARRGGLVLLRGAIRLNADLFDEAPDESFCGIVATEHGIVRFEEREGASLEIGNGSLSASLYGIVELGCASARITSWGRQSNNLAVNDSGRIDLRNTPTTLCARRRENTPIGPEHDGHILAEDAHIRIVGENDCAITLQKASTFTCNDIELAGSFRKTLWAMSGSMFVGRFLTDVTQVEAHTGASVHIEGIAGQCRGPVIATSAGVVSLPDRVVTAFE